MDFDLSQDQKDIKATARDLLAKRSSMEKVRAAAEARAYDDALSTELAGLGWPGIAIAEDHGGQGLGVVELAILLEELGYAVAASPLLGSAGAALIIEQAGSDAQRSAWLSKLASGEATGGFGEPGLVLDGDTADVLVLVDADGGARLATRADADVEVLEAIDPTRGYAKIRADGEALEGDVATGLDRAAVAVSAELTGLAQRALDMTLAYVKERKQFDVAVGAFQAVGHRCAQMLLHTESARSATYYAAWTADAAPERLQEGAALAKAAASEAGRETTASAIQAHGGIGFTWEADVHWLYKRAQMDAAVLGGGRTHRARLARLVGARLTGAAA